MIPTIETERCILRPLSEADVDGIFTLDSDPVVHRFLGGNTINGISDAKATIEFVQKQYVQHGIGRWAVIDKHNNAFMGWSGLKWEEHFSPKSPYYDLGYRLLPAYWGKGIATETAKASLDYGFKEMQLSQICAAAHMDNQGSIKVLTKVGMTPMGTFYYKDMKVQWYEVNLTEYTKAG